MRFTTPQLVFGTAAVISVIFMLFFISSYKGNPEVVTPAVSTTSALEVAKTTADTSVTDTQNSPLKGATSAMVPAKVAPPLVGVMAPELVRPSGFTNIDTLGFLSSDQITLKKFVGNKVVLLEFWTTSSMNSLRMVPYLDQWNLKYKDQGLVIMAVHTPRFTFERSKNVVDQYAHDHNMIFPLVIDNEYGTWNAYKNTLWPHEYLIDLNGRIVYEHQGEGAYDTMETKIRALLEARLAKLGKPALPYSTIETPKDAYKVDLNKVLSQETYFGSSRNQSMAEGIPHKDGPQSFEGPTGTLKLNKIYFTGNWNFKSEYAASMSEGAKVAYRYNASALYAVLGNEGTIRVKVLLDGVPLTTSTAGKDVRFEKTDSYVYVTQERIYEIVNSSVGYGEHTIELIPAGGGLDLYTLTFG